MSPACVLQEAMYYTLEANVACIFAYLQRPTSTLSQFRRFRCISAQEICEILPAVAKALCYLNRIGVCHRDVQPKFVLLVRVAGSL